MYVRSGCRYSLSDSYEGRFVVDRYTGVIRTSGSLDREQRGEYLLVVIATDAGLLPQSSTACVLVRVEDDNDNAPQFQRLSYVAQIPDGIPPGRSTTQLRLSFA